MFMQSLIEGTSLHIGIRLAHCTSGRCLHAKTFPYEPGSAADPADQETDALLVRTDCVTLALVSQLGVRKGTRPEGPDLRFASILVAVVTVRALYAGTLVTSWTTAPKSSSSALLAVLCLVLATLTIAARCYASKSATHPLAQLPPAHPLSSIKDSRLHSSRLVLSRFLRLPFASDSRHRNFELSPAWSLPHADRTKRELPSAANFNSFKSYDGKPIADQNSALYDVDGYSREDTTQLVLSSQLQKGIPARSLEGPASPNTTKPNSPGVNGSVSAWNASANAPQVSDRQDDQSLEPLKEGRPTGGAGIPRPMPPALDHSNNSLSSESGVLVLVVSAVVLTVALGLVTCVLSHYHRGGGTAAAAAAADPHDAAGHTPTTAPMLSVVSAGAAAGVGGMDRLRGRGGAAARDLAATRDRQVRIHAVRTDIALDLPPNIPLPDGEEHPFTSPRLHIRDSEQESEIYQKCIKPPPNRTVLESESPPPYRSSSAGLLGSLGSSSSGSSDWSGGSASLVMRCHSLSSTSKRPEAGPSQKTDFIQRTVKIFTGKKSQPPPAPSLPAVVVPSRRHADQPPSARPKPV